MEVMAVINLKLVWVSGTRQQSRRTERKGKMERSTAGRRLGDKKQRVDLADRERWSQKIREGKWKLKRKSEKSLHQNNGERPVWSKEGEIKERRGGEEGTWEGEREEITLKESHRVWDTIKEEETERVGVVRQQRPGNRRRGRSGRPLWPFQKGHCLFSFLHLYLSLSCRPSEICSGDSREMPLWNTSTLLRLTGNHKTPERSDYLSQWSWIKLFN